MVTLISGQDSGIVMLKVMPNKDRPDLLELIMLTHQFYNRI